MYSFEEIKNGLNNIYMFSEKHFVWFNEEKDASFYKKMALYYMWCECPWTTPKNEFEETILKKIIHYGNSAKIFDPNIELPIAELKEVELLKKGIKDDSNNKIGYLRNKLIYSHNDEVFFKIPGGFSLNTINAPHQQKLSFIYKDSVIEVVFFDEEKPFIHSFHNKIKCVEIEEIKAIKNNTQYDGKIFFNEEDKEYFFEGKVVSLDKMTIFSSVYKDASKKDEIVEVFLSVQYEDFENVFTII